MRALSRTARFRNRTAGHLESTGNERVTLNRLLFPPSSFVSACVKPFFPGVFLELSLLSVFLTSSFSAYFQDQAKPETNWGRFLCVMYTKKTILLALR